MIDVFEKHLRFKEPIKIPRCLVTFYTFTKLEPFLSSAVDVKTLLPSGMQSPVGGGGGDQSGGSGGPVDLRTDPRLNALSTVDPTLREKQLQHELLLLKQQQELQKQLLFAEFQKQHEVLTRQHEVQLQEHLKVRLQKQVLVAMVPVCTLKLDI